MTLQLLKKATNLATPYRPLQKHFKFYVILKVKIWKKILKIIFLAGIRLILEEKKTYFSHFSHNFSKAWHNWWRHHCYSCNSKNFFSRLFCNIKKYDCVKFHVKSTFLSGFLQGGMTLCPLPGAWSDKNTSGQIGSSNYFLSIF